MTAAAPRYPRRGHHAARNQWRHLMYLGSSGQLVALTPHEARRLIDQHGSVRRAADAIGLPKSTLFDVAADVGKVRR